MTIKGKSQSGSFLSKLLGLSKTTTKVTKTTTAKPKSPQPSKANSEESQRKAQRKGDLGEYKINFQLEQLGYRYLPDLLIRTDRGTTAQIDHVLITEIGIIVIETKNYAGKIIGKPQYKYWLHYLNNKKYDLYSPTRQNYGHTQALKKIFKGMAVDIYSIISFTRRCILQLDPDLYRNNASVLVIYDTELTETIKHKIDFHLKQSGPKLSDLEMDRICEMLKKANITDAASREQHVRDVSRKKS